MTKMMVMLQFEFRKKGGAAGTPVAKPLAESQPVESRGARDRSLGVREHDEAVRTSPHDAAKSRPRDVKEKLGAPPVREWDRHKLRQSPLKERDDRDRRGREEKPAKLRDKKEADRHERDRTRHERRGRERNGKAG